MTVPLSAQVDESSDGDTDDDSLDSDDLSS